MYPVDTPGVTEPLGPSAPPPPPSSPRASGASGRATRRDDQKRATRDALRSAALRLYGEQGFQDTTIDDIAAAVGVSKRTFFLHFASKDEVLLGHVAQQLEVLRGMLASIPEGPGIFERAGHAVTALAEDMQRRDDLLLQLDLLHRAPQLLAVNLEQFTAFEEAIADAVRQWLREGAPRRLTREQDGYAQLVGTVSIAALRAALTVWRRRGGRGSLGALVAKQVGTLRAGMSPP
jgi:AcrR family transcriptional regulator